MQALRHRIVFEFFNRGYPDRMNILREFPFQTDEQRAAVASIGVVSEEVKHLNELLGGMGAPEMKSFLELIQVYESQV